MELFLANTDFQYPFLSDLLVSNFFYFKNYNTKQNRWVSALLMEVVAFNLTKHEGMTLFYGMKWPYDFDYTQKIKVHQNTSCFMYVSG